MKTFDFSEANTQHAPDARVDPLHVALRRAAHKVAPLWPLESFVAVNPFVGLAELSFEDAARTMASVAGARSTMPRPYYAKALADGRIRAEDLAEALKAARSRTGLDLAGLLAAAHREPRRSRLRPLRTVADLCSDLTSVDAAALVVQRIGAWAEGLYDEGQAPWVSPWRDRGPYLAWRTEAQLDRHPEIAGLEGFRERVRALPVEPLEAARRAAQGLGIGPRHLEPYLHRLAMTIRGWMGLQRQRQWHRAARPDQPDPLLELLVIRLVWDWLILDTAPPACALAWPGARRELARGAPIDLDLEIDLVLHDAYERGARRRMVAAFEPGSEVEDEGRPRVQAAFCIDVRSERLRRTLEACTAGVQTVGVAGFFGVPMELVPLGRREGAAHCPALIEPAVVVAEHLADAMPEQVEQAVARRRGRDRLASAWVGLKSGAVSALGYVETMGLWHGVSLLWDGFIRSRVADAEERVDEAGPRVRPKLEPHSIPGVDDRMAGLELATRIELAAGLLSAMSLRSNLARVVLLCGHGARVVNNPHARGLGCGACGGQSGATNAQVAARLFADPEVRLGLARRGLPIPSDTIFLPAVHDTVSDEVCLLEPEQVPPSHRAEVDELRRALKRASALARQERAPTLAIEPGARLHEQVVARGRDWSQVRPEWGLAGCSLFIAAPRHRSRQLDLGGRAFLHDYRWQQDEGLAGLESLMAAPVVVATWINLQYFGSTVDNEALGAGDKTLHNVVGRLGVAEGGDGDLRTGLPLQSVHDGERWVHEPLRLSVLVEAPTEAIETVLQRRPELRNMVDNGWMHLLAMDDQGRVCAVRRPAGGWEPSSTTRSPLAPVHDGGRLAS